MKKNGKMKRKGGNPNWVPGVSGNPGGRKPSHFGKYLREHPSVPLVIEKILAAALDDNDPRQKDAWKIVANKIAPDLKAQEIKTDVQNHIGVIMMPGKVPIDLIDLEVLPGDDDDEDQARTPPTPTHVPLYSEGGVRDSQSNYSSPAEVVQEKDPPPPSEVGVPD